MRERDFFNRLGKLIYHIDGIYEEFAKLGNVKPNLLWILYALDDGKDHSQKEICEDWDLPRTTVNTIIKELELQGYVALKQIKGQKRELRIELTSAGKKFANQKLENIYQFESNVFSEILNDSDLIIEKLEVLLKSLKNNMEEK